MNKQTVSAKIGNGTGYAVKRPRSLSDHYDYRLATTKYRTPLVDTTPRRRTHFKKSHWFAIIGTLLLVFKLIQYFWSTVVVGLYFLGIAAVFIFIFYVLGSSGGSSEYSGYDDAYDAGWFDSWAYHGQDDNDHLY